MILDYSSSSFSYDRDDYSGSSENSDDEIVRLKADRKQKHVKDALRNRD